MLLKRILLLVLLAWPGWASACGCALYDSIEDARARAGIAVEARMLSVVRRHPPWEGMGHGALSEVEQVRWRVTRAFRGPLAEGAEFVTNTQLSPPSCGTQVTGEVRPGHPSVQLHPDWQLFFPGEKPGSIISCSRSAPLPAAPQAR